MCQGLVIRARRTGLVSFATAVRIAMLFVYLWIGLYWFSGAKLGAFALLGCVGTETLVIAYFAWKVHLKETGEDEKSFSEILRYGLPLAYSSGLQQTVPLLINAIISRLTDGTLALAGFGVVNGLARCFLSPLRNLVQTAQTLIRSHEEIKVMLQFTSKTVLFFVALMVVLFFSPLRAVILGKVMGLNSELSRYVTAGTRMTFLLAIFWGYSALLRGILSGMRRTGDIAVAVPIRLVVAAMVCSMTMFYPKLNGAVVGILAFSAAFAAEAAFLTWRLRRHDMTAANAFGHRL